MENEMNMGMNDEMNSNKSKLPLILGIVAAIILVLVLVISAVVTSPKVMLGILIKNTPDAVNDFMAADMGEDVRFMTESHQSETKIKMAGDDLGLEGDIELELKSAYQNTTGDFAAEMEFGLADLDALTGGIYLSGSEVALISSILSDKYVVDMESEEELGKDTTLEQRLNDLIPIINDEEFLALWERLGIEVKDMRKLAINQLARITVSKGTDDLELFGEDKGFKYVEVVMDEDDFAEWAELFLDAVAEDQEFSDLIEEIADYLNSHPLLEGEFELDDFDLEDICDEMIEEIEDAEAEVTLRIYRDGFTPIAYEFEYKDSVEEAEGIILMYTDKKNVQLLYDLDMDGEKLYYNVYNQDDKLSVIEYDASGMKYEIKVEEVKNGQYEITGEIDYGYMGKGEIEGEILESRNETTFEMTLDMDVDGSKMEIKYEGSMIVDGSITSVEVKVDAEADGEELLSMNFECEIEEVRKNQEYVTEGELSFTDAYTDQEYKIDIENTTIFGKTAEVDLPSWSKNDVYAKISDKEAMQELFDALSIDFSEGINDIVSTFMYGGIY